MPVKLLLTFFLFITSFGLKAQNISVRSFQALPNDQTARVTDPVTDQNGEKCALIKVVTNQSGFVWEGGMLGITKTVKKTGEYWVYVPRGSKRITVKHKQLGVLRDYIYPEAIREATVYEMVLTTAEVKTIVEERKIPSRWLVIKSEPSGARVFVNDKLAGNTPFQRKYKKGNYTYRVEKKLYHPAAGKVSLQAGKRKLNVRLEPRFGRLEVTSVPEEGMMIYLDDRKTGKRTPATLEKIASGRHIIELQSQWYQPQGKQVTVSDAQTSRVQFEMEPVFAEVSVKTQPPASIFVDDQRMGEGSWNGRLREGIYTIKADKERYHSQSRQLEIVTGEKENLSFELEGRTGSADVITTPLDAVVYLNGQKQGTSPITLDDLLIGRHNLTIRKEGYEAFDKSIDIVENQTVTIEPGLQKEQKPQRSRSEYVDMTPFESRKASKPALSKRKYNGGPANMFLSLLVPGLGDKAVSGKSGAGRTLTTYGLIAGGLACKFFSDYQYKNYHNATMPSEMDRYYETANDYNKLFYVLTASGIIYWIYDIVWVADKGFENLRNQRRYTSGFNMNYDPGIHGWAVSVHIEF
jgi:hypothetical protein